MALGFCMTCCGDVFMQRFRKYSS
uniref:Uncharacterized protein n=1 Tax=Arundo donax TaxID=35708 RepID=A0A0A8ZEY8_ARUDO